MVAKIHINMRLIRLDGWIREGSLDLVEKAEVQDQLKLKTALAVRLIVIHVLVRIRLLRLNLGKEKGTIPVLMHMRILYLKKALFFMHYIHIIQSIERASIAILLKLFVLRAAL